MPACLQRQRSSIAPYRPNKRGCFQWQVRLILANVQLPKLKTTVKFLMGGLSAIEGQHHQCV